MRVSPADISPSTQPSPARVWRSLWQPRFPSQRCTCRQSASQLLFFDASCGGYPPVFPPFPSGGSCSAGWPHLWAAGSSRSRFSSICLWPRGLNPSPTTYCLVCLWCGDDGDAECGMRAAGGGRRVFTYRASAALAHRHWAVPSRRRTPGESLPPPHAASGTAAHRVPQAPSLAAGIDASSG